MPAKKRNKILTHKLGKKVAAYATELVSVGQEVMADPTNPKLLAAFVELLPTAAWTFLEMTAQPADRA